MLMKLDTLPARSITVSWQIRQRLIDALNGSFKSYDDHIQYRQPLRQHHDADQSRSAHHTSKGVYSHPYTVLSARHTDSVTSVSHVALRIA